MRSGKVVASLLAGVMMFGCGAGFMPKYCIPVHAEDYTVLEEGVLTYKVYSTYAEVSKCESSAKEVTIPAYVEDKPVLSIGASAFNNYGASALETIELPDTLISIGDRAFSGCKMLQKVNLPSSVKEIHTHAFSYCSSLTSIQIPDAVTLIPNFAFSECTSLQTVSIPSSVTTIGTSAFQKCALKSVILREGLTTVGELAFQGCPNLTSVSIPSTVTKIGSYCFSDCPMLESVQITEGTACGTWGGLSLCENCTNLTSIKIPKSFGQVPSSAFKGCSALTSVTIPDGITEINSSAFYDCISITEIDLPESVKRIEAGAFTNCAKLQSITIPNGNCSMDYAASTICNYTLNGTSYFNGTIYSTESEGSSITTTPWEYANINSYRFLSLTAQTPTESKEEVATEPTTEPAAPSGVVGDHNGDGVVNASDAALILIYAAAVGAGYQGTLPEYFAR